MLRQAVFRCYLQHNRLNPVLCKSSAVYLNNGPIASSSDFPNFHQYHTTNITYNFKHATAENFRRHRKASFNLSEKEFLVKVRDDPDTFGPNDEEPPLDPGDVQEQEYLEEKPVASQKLSTKRYADVIKALLRKRQVKEAIDVLEVRMLKHDRVKPENYIYNLLIGACGRVGYTKKAFSLYNDMKKRLLQITPGTYTALFNACANSPWPRTDGLTRARYLREIIIEKMYQPNSTNYNAMIKAFGRGGDLEMAFALVDEMSAKKFIIKDDTINFLLQACITDKEAGFRHALLVWRKFIKKRIAPSVYSYNLMLRCIRECGLGDIETTTDVINQLIPSSSSNQQVLMLNEPELCSGEAQLTVTTPEESIKTNKPNLMAKQPCLGSIMSLSEVKQPEDRLLLVGGCSGFLENMAKNDCAPNVITFTQLLDNIPSTLASEKDLLQALRRNNVQPDVDFFNMLIKKRSMRFDYESAREVLTMIKTARFRPNLVTYGILALGCKTREESMSLLQEMSEANYRINIEILGGMLSQACYHNNFPYVMHIMELCLSEGIKPSKKFMENLEAFRRKSKAISNDSENPLAKSTGYQKGQKIFKMRYKTWLGEVEVDESENAHPWQQYRQTTNTNVRYYKDKQNKTRFKPVHTSLFKQKMRVQNVKVKK